MTIDDKIRDEKLKYDSNREAANISTLSHSGRNTTIWPKEMIVQAMFTYFPLGKTVKKQIKKIKNQGEKQINALKSMGKNLLNLMHLLKKKKKVYRLISIPSW